MWTLKTKITEKNIHPTVMPPYQAVIVKRLIASDYFLTTGQLHLLAIDELGENAPSRASVIFFTHDLFNYGYAEMKNGTGKGGVHAKYNITMTTEQFIQELRNHFTKALEDIITEIFN